MALIQVSIDPVVVEALLLGAIGMIAAVVGAIALIKATAQARGGPTKAEQGMISVLAGRLSMKVAAPVDTGELQFLDGVGDLVQVMLGQMQIPGRYFQILMTEQKLDGAQVGTGFQ